MIGRLKATVVTVETSTEHMLEEAGPLAFHYRTTVDGLKIAVWRVSEENFDLPLAFGIVAISKRIDFCGQEVDTRALANSVPGMLQIKQSRRGDCCSRFQ